MRRVLEVESVVETELPRHTQEGRPVCEMARLLGRSRPWPSFRLGHSFVVTGCGVASRVSLTTADGLVRARLLWSGPWQSLPLKRTLALTGCGSTHGSA